MNEYLLTNQNRNSTELWHLLLKNIRNIRTCITSSRCHSSIKFLALLLKWSTDSDYPFVSAPWMSTHIISACTFYLPFFFFKHFCNLCCLILQNDSKPKGMCTLFRIWVSLYCVPVTVAWQSWKLSAKELHDLQFVVKSSMAFFDLGLF